MTTKKAIGLLSVPVIVAALGYFVDIYDLLLFSIIRVKSLSGLGLSGKDLEIDGKLILTIQMYGLLIGGFLWGIMGDKKGRLSVLFGSILLYSFANIANGFVQNVTQYAITRFIAGIGLAGELGAGITLVSELIPKEKRGISTSIVAGVGLTGAIGAYLVAHMFDWFVMWNNPGVHNWAQQVIDSRSDWRICYFIGGVLGLLLLILRVSVFESGMYKSLQQSKVKKGNFLMILTDKKRLKTYFLSYLIGLPCWYVIGILFTFSKEFGEHFGIKQPIDSGKSVMFAYIFISIGDLLIGFFSNYLKSRKKALMFFYALTIAGIIVYFFQNSNSTESQMYGICMFLGFATGFWALFVTMAAEHFGTNLRATVTTTIPNLVRGSVGIMIAMFAFFEKSPQLNLGYIGAGIVTGIIVMTISTTAVIMTTETFGKDLNYVEE